MVKHALPFQVTCLHTFGLYNLNWFPYSVHVTLMDVLSNGTCHYLYLILIFACIYFQTIILDTDKISFPPKGN